MKYIISDSHVGLTYYARLYVYISPIDNWVTSHSRKILSFIIIYYVKKKLFIIEESLWKNDIEKVKKYIST